MSEVAAPRRRGRPPGSKNKPKPVAGGVSYVARKPMTIGDRKVRVGDVVPEAGSWPRVEAWVRSGFLDVRE